MIWFQIIFGSIVLFVGFYLGYFLLDRVLMRGTYSIKNSHDLLKREKVEEWNSLRDLNPDWLPDLTGFDFSNMNLAGTNFRNAKLNNVSFKKSILDNSDFSGASLEEADFTNASLKRVILENTNINSASFKDAILEDISFNGANFEDSDLTVDKVREVGDSLFKITPEIIEEIRKEPGIISKFNHKQFEELIVILLRLMGFEADLASAPGLRDSGYDILAIRRNPIGDFLYVIECKSYMSTRPVGVAPVLSLYSIKVKENADRAMLVTNSFFSIKAREFAQRHKDLDLVDNDRLLEWIDKLKLL